MPSDTAQTPEWTALVDLIAAAVVRQITASPEGAGTAGASEAAESEASAGPRVGWLVAAPCSHLDAIARQVRVLGRLGHAQTVIAAAAAFEGLAGIEGQAEVRLWRESAAADGSAGAAASELLVAAASLDVLLVASLGWQQAVALASLDDTSPLVAVALEVLGRGAPVYLLAGEGLGGIHRVPAGESPAVAGGHALGDARSVGAVAQQAAARRRILERLGLRPVGLDGIGALLGRLGAARDPAVQSLSGLLREQDVEALAAQGRRVVRLPAGVVVTPLARDRARALGVRLETA